MRYSLRRALRCPRSRWGLCWCVMRSSTRRAPARWPPQPDFGPNVVIFDPSMPTSQIQATVDAIAPSRSTTRWARSATRCCSSPAPTAPPTQPADVQVGYYTEVAGLGASPSDVDHQRPRRRLQPVPHPRQLHRAGQLLALGVEPDRSTSPAWHGCRASGDFWAVSQAAPMRRVNITGGNLTLMDYCTAGPQYASGGFIADSQDRLRHQRLAAAVPRAGQQHRRLVERRLEPGLLRRRGRARRSRSRHAVQPAAVHDPGRRARSRGRSRSSTSTPAGSTTSSCPALRTNSSGTTWGSGPTAGTSMPIEQFYVAKPTDDARRSTTRSPAGRTCMLHARRLPPRPEHRREARRHGRARPRASRRWCPTTA